MKINGNVNYAINGYASAARNGNVLIGAQNTSMAFGNANIYTQAGAFSLLHLNGAVSGGVDNYQEFGYRPWMYTGLTMTGNRDFAYFGLRQVGTGADHTETVFMWADNGAGGGPDSPDGPDNMVFRFSGYGGSDGTIISNDRRSTTDLDGLHVATFNPTGYFGLGNTFGMGTGVPLNFYVRPKSLFHMSYDYLTGNASKPYGFMQISYRAPNTGSPFIGHGEEATDGLRFGIDNDIFGTGVNQHLNAYLRWQEASSFIIQTEDDNTNSSISSNERLRVTSVGALALNYSTAEYLGVTFPINSTRVSISSDGALPVKKPMSLLHLGKDLDADGPISIADGWRNWMDIGTFTTNGADHMYVGLKNENANGERMDAVINWGDDQGTANGPDNLRFIFTSPIGSTTATSGAQANGLEGMRMTPSPTSGIYTGIGGSSGNTYFGGSINPTSTLEVNSWGATNSLGGSSGLRFTNLNSSTPTIGNPGNGVLSVNNNGDVIYVPAPSSSAFVPCSVPGSAANLNTDSKLNLNDNNLYFENNNLIGKNHIGMGYNCSAVLPAKLSVNQSHPILIGVSSTAISGQNHDISNSNLLTFTGVYGLADGSHLATNRTTNIGGEFIAINSHTNYGIRATGTATANLQYYSYGGQFFGNNGVISKGIESYAFGGTGTSNLMCTGVHGVAKSSNVANLHNTGGYFQATGSRGNNFGVRGEAIGSSGDPQAFLFYGLYANAVNNTGSSSAVVRAGYFVGISEGTASGVYTSDQMFKTDVNQIDGALNVLNELKPKDYYMDTNGFPQMNFSSKKQFGFIAQDVEVVLPNLVHNSLFPAEYDSLGVIVSPAIPYKSMNYNGIIPINTAAIQELDREVQNRTLSDQSIKSNVVDLNNSLTKVLAMRGVSYDWTPAGQSTYSLDTCNHVGFIAQELQQVDSRLTFIGRDSLLHVEYEKVVPILVEAVQELNNEVNNKDSLISDLNARLTHLENCLSGILPFLCYLSNSAIEANTPAQQNQIRTKLEVELSNRAGIILDQNVPNPFAEQTEINFTIPEAVKRAQIHFYNMEGRIIQTVEITERGQGSLTVFGSDLSTGTYTYTLVADGINVATKKMVKN